MTLNERIDAAAAEMNAIWRSREGWDSVPEADRVWLRRAAMDVLRCAYPEDFPLAAASSPA